MAIINGHYDVAAFLLNQGRGPESGRRDRPHGAVLGGRLPHHAGVEPAVAPSESRIMLTSLESDPGAARSWRERQRATEEAAAVSHQARSRRRHDADDRHHAAAARRQGRRLPWRCACCSPRAPIRSSRRASGINPLMAAAGLGTKEEDTTGRIKTEAEAIESIKLCLRAGATSTRRMAKARRRCTAPRRRARTRWCSFWPRSRRQARCEG